MVDRYAKFATEHLAGDSGLPDRNRAPWQRD
jgi:hypothetical protein